MEKKLIENIEELFRQNESESEIAEKMKNEGYEIADINIALAQARGILIETPAPHLLSPTDLLKNAWIEYRKKINFFIKILILPFFLNALTTAIIHILFPGNISQDLLKIFLSNPLYFFLLYFAVPLMLFFIVSAATQAILLYAVIKGDPASKNAMHETYKNSIPYFFHVAWISILSACAVFGGLFLGFIPGIIFYLWLSFSLYIAYDQNLFGIAALRASKIFVRGIMGQVFIRTVFLFFSTFCVAAASSILTDTLFQLAYFVFPAIPQNHFITLCLIDIIYSIIPLLFSPLWMIYFLLLYKNIQTHTTASSSQGRTGLGKMGIASLLGWIFFIVIATAATIFISKYIINDKVLVKNIDLITIQIPLTFHKMDKGYYPENLDGLVPKYINELPPLLKDHSAYSYFPNKTKTGYRLCTVIDGAIDECVGEKQ